MALSCLTLSNYLSVLLRDACTSSSTAAAQLLPPHQHPNTKVSGETVPKRLSGYCLFFVRTTNSRMSGTEATVATRLIDACIGTAKVIIKIARAIQDAQGLPLELRELCEQPRVIQALLESAQERFAEGQVTEDVTKSTEPILKQLKQALGELLDIFRAAFPQDGDNRSKRVWKGARGVVFGRDSPLHKLLGTMQDILQLLEQKEMYVIGDKLDALQRLTAALAQDETGKNVYSGTGNLFSNESGTQTNHLQSGERSQQIWVNNPGVYNAGPASM